MKRLLFGFALGTALVYGWRRLVGEEAEPQPSWTGTDDDLLARTREEAAQEEQAETEQAGPRQPS